MNSYLHNNGKFNQIIWEELWLRITQQNYWIQQYKISIKIYTLKQKN